MRIALLSLIDRDPSLETRVRAQAPHCGKPIAAHQLENALAAGAEKICCLVDDASLALAEDLEQRATAAEVRFAALRTPRALRGQVTAADELIVIDNALLPDPRTFTQVTQRAGVAAFPAGIAVPLGFERIDRETAWAGVLLTRGALVEKLTEFEEDIDIVATLLRLSLQAGVPLTLLDPALLTTGAWLKADDPVALAEREERWFAGQAAQTDMRAPGIALAEKSGLHLARDVGGTRYQTLPTVLATLLFACALLTGALGWLAPAFVLAGGGFILARTGQALHRVLAPSLGPRGRRPPFMKLACDAVIGLLIVLASSEQFDWLRWFVPLVLFAALYLAAGEERGWRIALGDRSLLAFALGGAQVFDLAFPVAAAIAVLVLALPLFERHAEIMAD